MPSVHRSIVDPGHDARLQLARDAYLAAHQRLADVAKRYHAIHAANWHPIRDEYHIAMMAAVEASLLLHEVEASHQREREALRGRLAAGASSLIGRIAASSSTALTSRTSASPP